MRSKDGRKWSELEKVEAGKNAYQDTDLEPDLEYRYRIIAEDQDGLISDPVESNSIASPLPKPEG
jgi:hypothetical protein